MLITVRRIAHIDILAPKGIKLDLKVEDVKIDKDYVKCTIKKYSGDDPDVTNGILVYSKVSKNHGTTIKLDGGIGVGRVAKSGLEQLAGSTAIKNVRYKHG